MIIQNGPTKISIHADQNEIISGNNWQIIKSNVPFDRSIRDLHFCVFDLKFRINFGININKCLYLMDILANFNFFQKLPIKF